MAGMIDQEVRVNGRKEMRDKGWMEGQMERKKEGRKEARKVCISNVCDQ